MSKFNELYGSDADLPHSVKFVEDKAAVSYKDEKLSKLAKKIDIGEMQKSNDKEGSAKEFIAKSTLPGQEVISSESIVQSLNFEDEDGMKWG